MQLVFSEACALEQYWFEVMKEGLWAAVSISVELRVPRCDLIYVVVLHRHEVLQASMFLSEYP